MANCGRALSGGQLAAGERRWARGFDRAGWGRWVENLPTSGFASSCFFSTHLLAARYCIVIGGNGSHCQVAKGEVAEASSLISGQGERSSLILSDRLPLKYRTKLSILGLSADLTQAISPRQPWLRHSTSCPATWPQPTR